MLGQSGLHIAIYEHLIEVLEGRLKAVTDKKFLITLGFLFTTLAWS